VCAVCGILKLETQTSQEEIAHVTVNGLNPGVSVVRIV